MMGRAQSRERRVMVTGNLLAAFATLGARARSRTTRTPRVQLRQGVLMPRSFDLEEFVARPAGAAQRLGTGARVPAQRRTAGTRCTSQRRRGGSLAARSGDGFAITVPSSKADGAQYFPGSRTLRKATGDFTSTGKYMSSPRLSPMDLQSALEALEALGVRFITKTFKDEAKRAGGTVIADKSVKVAKQGPDTGDVDGGSLDVSYKPGEKVLPEEAMNRHARTIFRGSALQAVVIDPNHPPAKWERHMAYLQKKGVAQRWRAWATTDPVTGQRTVLFAQGRFESLDQLERKALHEAAHHGLDAMFGKAFTALAQRAYREVGREGLSSVIADYFRKQPFDPENPEHVALAVNEYMARLAEQVAQNKVSEKLRAVWDAFLKWMKDTLRIQGWRRTFANAELRDIARRAVKVALSSGEQTAEHPVTDLGLALQDENEQTERSQRQFVRWLKRGQPIDRIFRAAFTPFGAASIDERGLLHVNPRFKSAAKRAADRLSRTATQRFTWLHPLAEKARFAVEDTWGFRLKDRVAHGLIDRYGTPQDFIVRERQKDSEARTGLLEAYKLGKQLMESASSKEEAELLGAALRGEEVTDEQVKTVAAPIVDAIEDLGNQLVEAGVLSREAFERNRRKYHHRSYLRNEHTYGSALTKWMDSFAEKRRVRLQGDVFKGRGIRFEVPIDKLKAALPPEWWGARYEKAKADVSLGGSRWRVLDQVRLATVPEQVEGLPGTSQRQPKVLSRVYWPADEQIPERFAGHMDRGIFEVRHVTPNKVAIWRDFNDEERRRMGEILDGRYNAVKTYAMMVKDLATAKFFGDIAKNPEWAQQDEPRKADGSVDWVAANEVTWRKHSSYANVGWVRVPEGKIADSQTSRYGQLAGMYVRAPIWRDMAELEYMQLPSAWKSLLKLWKTNKTARSPVVHFNNVMSNFILADLIDVRGTDLWQGLKSYAANDQHYLDAYRHGVFGGDSLDRDIREQILDPILRELKDEAGPGARLRLISRLTELLRSGDRKLRRTYEMEDEIFRMAAYMKFLNDGDTPEVAAARARRQFIDYDIRAPWINALRSTVMPFISYTYRAVPLLAEAAYNRPWKIAKYMTFAMVANAIGYALTEDDDEDRERRVMNEQYQGYTWLGTPRMIRLPFDDEYSNPAFLDIRRWIPAGDVFDMQGTTVDWLPAWMQIGGPLVLSFELGANINTYKDEPIYDKDIDTKGEIAGKLAKHAWQGFMPNAPWLPGSYSFENLANAARGAKNGAYQDVPLGATVLGTLGPKIRYQNTDYNIDRLRIDLEIQERKLDAARRRATHSFARGQIDDDDLRDELATIEEKKQRAILNFKQKVDGPPPPEQ
jgi:hypothetical protein